MPPIRSEVEEVRRTAEECACLAQQIMGTYLDINTKVTAYEDNIFVLKKNLLGITSISELDRNLDISERNALTLEIAILDIQSARLKANLSSACSRLMGELGNHLDIVRIGLNSLIIKFDKSLIPDEQLFILVSASNEIDEVCRSLGKLQFSGVEGMDNIFLTLEKIKSLGHS